MSTDCARNVVVRGRRKGQMVLYGQKEWGKTFAQHWRLPDGTQIPGDRFCTTPEREKMSIMMCHVVKIPRPDLSRRTSREGAPQAMTIRCLLRHF